MRAAFLFLLVLGCGSKEKTFNPPPNVWREGSRVCQVYEGIIRCYDPVLKRWFLR